MSGVEVGATGEPSARPFIDLRATGLLWLINRVVFHPRGFALALTADETGAAIGWTLEGDGNDVWRFVEDIDDRGFERAETTLRDALGGPAAPSSTVPPPVYNRLGDEMCVCTASQVCHLHANPEDAP